MKRSLARGLGAAAVLAVAGCSQNGSYRLSWNFQVAGATVSSAPVTVSPAVGCGRYYVDSILVSGTDGTGDVQQVRAICTPGSVISTVPDGTWSFQVQMLDAQGRLVPSTMPIQKTSPEPIASGTPQTQFPVIILTPVQASSNGIDGGTDGGVDQADAARDGGVDQADAARDGDPNGMHD